MMNPEIKRITDGDLSAEYIVFGKGEGKKSLVILPGIGYDPISASAVAIAAAFANYAEKYRIYVLDRRDNLCEGYTVADMADDAAREMKLLGISGADVFGASMGGMIAQELAIRYPELCSHVVVAASLCRPNPNIIETMDRFESYAHPGSIWELKCAFMRAIYTKEVADGFCSMAPLPEDAPEIEAAKCERFRVLTEACKHSDTYGGLPRVKCKMLIVGAENDTVMSPEASELIAEHSSGELFIYPHYCHAVYDEAPDFKDRMFGFFER